MGVIGVAFFLLGISSRLKVGWDTVGDSSWFFELHLLLWYWVGQHDRHFTYLLSYFLQFLLEHRAMSCSIYGGLWRLSLQLSMLLPMVGFWHERTSTMYPIAHPSRKQLQKWRTVKQTLNTHCCCCHHDVQLIHADVDIFDQTVDTLLTYTWKDSISSVDGFSHLCWPALLLTIRHLTGTVSTLCLLQSYFSFPIFPPPF